MRLLLILASAGAAMTAGARDGHGLPNEADYTFIPYSDSETLKDAPSYVPQGCAEFEVARPRRTDGAVVKAAEFGLSEARTDNGAAIQAALDACRRRGAGRLELAPGVYKIHDPSGIVIDSFDDFVFDGKGAVLVFCRPSRRATAQYEIDATGANFLVTNCHRTVVRNFKMDWDWAVDPLATFARVTAVKIDEENDDASYFDLKLTDMARHPRWPARVPVQIVGRMREDRSNIAASGWGCGVGYSEGHFGSKNEWIAPDTLRVWPAVKQAGEWYLPVYDKMFSVRRNRICARSHPVGSLVRILHYYYGMNGFNLHSCEDLTVEDVDVWSCRGMAFQAMGSITRWQVLRSSVAVPPHLKGKRAIKDAGVYFGKNVGVEK